MANVKSLCINGDCSELDYVTESEMDTAISAATNGMFKVVGGTVDNVSIAAKSNNTVAVAFSTPEGYTFGAYREISVQAASDGGTGNADVLLRWFGTTGGGTKANIALKNVGDNAAKVKVTVTALLVKTL